MGRNSRKLQSIGLLLCIVAAATPIIHTDDVVENAQFTKNYYEAFIGGPTITSTAHDAINIAGDAELDMFPNKTGGDGSSWALAYIIENFEIILTLSDECIDIRDTTRHLIIRNCTLVAPYRNVVMLDNCSNIEIQDSRISSSALANDHGIYIINSQSCKISNNNISAFKRGGVVLEHVVDVNITGNFISSNISTWSGIWTWMTSDQCAIFGNNISRNSAPGIYIEYSNCSITNNNITYNSGNGITAVQSGISHINFNNVSFNTGAGIHMTWDNYNVIETIERNYVQSNTQHGILISNYEQETIASNTIINNSQSGINATSTSCTIIDNVISGNNQNGLILNACSGTTVLENRIEYNVAAGISSQGSSNCTIQYNRIRWNYNGIVIGSSSTTSNYIKKNMIANNTWVGVLIDGGRQQWIYLNMFASNGYAQASIQGTPYTMRFDNGTYGNYWSDYETRYPSATSNGIWWDIPYTISSSSDNRPLVAVFDPEAAGRIKIDGNVELAEVADSGDGSAGNPFVIENKTINGYFYGTCITIKNTDMYVRVQNCNLSFSGTNWVDAAIHIENSMYVNITGNTIMKCNYGVQMIKSNKSEMVNNTILNCTLSIEISLSQDNILHKNMVNNTASESITLSHCTNINVTSNQILNSQGDAIRLVPVNRCTVSHNQISILPGSSNAGISFHASDMLINNNNITSPGLVDSYFHVGLSNLGLALNLDIEANSLINCGFGHITENLTELASLTLSTTNKVNGKPVYFYYDLHTASQFNFTNAGEIILAGCSNAKIQDQHIINGTIGISLLYCSFITLFNNNVSGNGMDGIYAYAGDHFNLTSNTMDHNGYRGGQFVEISNISITGNNARHNKESGIFVYGVNNMVISGNNFSWNEYNNLAINGNNTIITNNDLSYAYYKCLGIIGGINVTVSDHTIISRRYISDFGIEGGGENITITRNSFLNFSNGVYVNGMGSRYIIVDRNYFEDCNFPVIFENVNSSEITNNLLNGSSSTINRGLQIIGENSWNCLVENNSFPLIMNEAIVITQGGGTIIRGNKGLINRIWLFRTVNARVENNTISTLSEGIRVQESTNITLLQNTLIYCSITVIQSTRGNVTMNNIINATENGISLTTCINVTIYGNIITGSGQDGIYITGGERTMIWDNSILSSQINGINILLSPQQIVSGNNMSKNHNQGIRLSGCDHCVIHDNYLSNNTYDDINVNGDYNQVYHNFVDYSWKISVVANNVVFENYYLLEDSDFDGLFGWQEYCLGTNPALIDTDNDNYLDGYEVRVGTDPLDPLDTPILSESQYDIIFAMMQGNATLISIVQALLVGNWTYLQSMQSQLVANITSIQTVLYQLDDCLGDRDCDGLPDIYEIGNGTNPLLIDSDNDNLNDAFELKIGTNPLNDDSDGDGYLDGAEFAAGTDPMNAAEYPRNNQTQGNSASDILASAAVLVAVGAVVILFVASKKNSKSRTKNVPK